MTEDYYNTLGIDKNATKEEIKKAYKKLAKKYHPDNGETGDAEKFKKINEAAAVLSDDKRRQHYDQFGSADTNAFRGFDFNEFGSQFGSNFDDIFEHFGDIFEGFGFGPRKRRRSVKGEDLRYDLDISLEEAATGFEKSIVIDRLDQCSTCTGTGAKPGSGSTDCEECSGRGQITRTQRTPFGIFQTSGICPRCRGEGTVIKEECHNCDGTGLGRARRKLEVKIPAGVDDGMQLRVQGEGNAAKGGSHGDLYVFIHVKEHEHFVRDGDDIHLEYPVSASQAALGTEIQVPTLDGKAKLRVPAGTQPDTVLRLRGKGIRNVHGGAMGDELIKIRVKIPTSLSKRERELFEKLDEESKKSGFFKNLF